MTRRPAAATALALAAVLTAVGCSADDPVVETREGPGPLTEIARLSMVDNASDWIERETVREESIAACMHEAGFEYRPHVPTPDQLTFEPDETVLKGTLEFAERYGYGVAELPSQGGIRFSDFGPDPEQAAYLARMSPTELEAYETALDGRIVDGRPGEVITRAGGCRELARDPGADDAERAFLRGVEEEFVRFYRSMSESSAFDELDRDWSECLREAGYTEASPRAAEERVREEWRVALEAADLFVSPTLVAEHQPAEIALATADARCRERVDYQERHDAIAWDLEQAYVDTHAADLETYVQALAERDDPAD